MITILVSTLKDYMVHTELFNAGNRLYNVKKLKAYETHFQDAQDGTC